MAENYKKNPAGKNESLHFAYSRIGEDLEASLKWYLHAEKIVVSGHKVYNYIIQPNSLNAVTDNIAQFIGGGAGMPPLSATWKIPGLLCQ